MRQSAAQWVHIVLKAPTSEAPRIQPSNPNRFIQLHELGRGRGYASTVEARLGRISQSALTACAHERRAVSWHHRVDEAELSEHLCRQQGWYDISRLKEPALLPT
eukprot:55361-Eustigmatos_ZCMA.PRE.1